MSKGKVEKIAPIVLDPSIPKEPLASAVEIPPPQPSIPPCDNDERATILESRKWHVELDARASDSFDNAMLTLCAGALALSVSLNGSNAVAALGLAQALFATALVAEVLALRCGRVVSLKRLIDAHDARLLEQIASMPRERKKDVTYYLKNAVLIAFVVGVCAMLFFVCSQTIGK